MSRAYIGISGWRYARWRGDFYPRGLVQRRELEYSAERMNSAEINGTFYSLQRPSSFDTWREATPEDFVFAVKGGRYLTHMLRLHNVESALANFVAQGILSLGPKLGPILWQLPERQQFDAERLAGFLRLLPRSTTDAAILARSHDARLDGRDVTAATTAQPLRHALEVRHPSFDTDAAKDLLREHDIALVVADTAGRFPDIRAETSDFRYVRLHGETELYTSGYTDESLDRWADDIRDWLQRGDVYVYFDNDSQGHAPFDAIRLAERVAG